jgi:hypothetical protein
MAKTPAKRDPSAGLLEAYQKACAASKVARAKEDIARARITAKGLNIEHEYEPMGSSMKPKLRPMRGLEPQAKKRK